MTIDVTGDAFLRGMVRRIVAVLIEVGHGKMDEQRSPRRSAPDDRPSTGRVLRRTACASGESPSGDAPRRRWTGRARRAMSAKTYAPRESEIERRWYVVDAADETLGRLASRVARVLEGKHKPTYTPNLDSGDHVIILNAARIAVTRDKLETKIYTATAGIPRATRRRPSVTSSQRRPEEVIRRAVKGMLPHNRLGAQQLRKLKIYPGTDHPHQAQQPEPLA